MRAFSIFSLVALFGFLPGLSLAQGPTGDEALQLLQKVATAAQKLNYTGVFVYQNGVRSETSRITHMVEQGNEFEKLEVLDGSPREVIRHNDEVRCLLPDNKLMIIERRSSRQLFPALLPGNMASLTEYYQIRAGDTGRVAGINARRVLDRTELGVAVALQPDWRGRASSGDVCLHGAAHWPCGGGFDTSRCRT